MFVLETGTGKSLKIVGCATSEPEAIELVSAAQQNGVTVNYRKMTTDPVIFKTRDYDSEFKELISNTLNNFVSIRTFPYDKLKMSESEYEALVRPVINEDYDSLIMDIARLHQMYVDLGDYGYGRSIEWTSSSGYTEGQ